jgi:hypothetical protein
VAAKKPSAGKHMRQKQRRKKARRALKNPGPSGLRWV